MEQVRRDLILGHQAFVATFRTSSCSISTEANTPELDSDHPIALN
jgi:hypothetical protein